MGILIFSGRIDMPMIMPKTCIKSIQLASICNILKIEKPLLERLLKGFATNRNSLQQQCGGAGGS
tara:strand:+ start:208 stop:402 length:195 start_codon:yes stop_codon:yes gene_type:complete